jgi:serine O-acetyltransferase
MLSTATILELAEARDVWAVLRQDAVAAAGREPDAAGMLRGAILDHDTLEEALAVHLAQKLGGPRLSSVTVRDLCLQALAEDRDLPERLERDLRAVRSRDPACRSYLQPFLFYKGFAALEAHRVGHWLWRQGREVTALHLQSRVSELLQVDIHPAARLGSGIFIDHATGVVIGETSVVGDDVSILQSVTLGGNGKERGDRHPKIGRGVLISVGASVLGNIRVGEEARVAAGSVVLEDVPPHSTVAGVPARLVRGPACNAPALSMDHFFGEGI